MPGAIGGAMANNGQQQQQQHQGAGGGHGGANNQQLGLQMHQMHLGMGGGGPGGDATGSSPPGAAAVELVHDLILDSSNPNLHGMTMGGGGGGGGGGRSPSPARLAYTSEKHPRATFLELNLIRKHHDLCDVAINVAGRKIYAHK